METQLSRLLDALPAMVWTAGLDGTSEFVNQHWSDYTGLSLQETLRAGWASLFHPDDLAAALAAWESTSAATPPSEINLEARLRRFDGVYRRFKVQTRPLRDAAGQVTGWCGINIDVDDQKRAEAQLAAEKRLLELVARGVELCDVLEELCVEVEGLSPGSLCSILFVAASGRHFRVGAGRSLPEAYSAVLDYLKIDPHYGPCSLAVTTRSTVITKDPSRDPRWQSSDWPALIAKFGLASCWSAPIFGSRGDVLGIFAIYKRKPQGPTDDEQELIDRFAKIAGIAIERARSDSALKTNAAQLRRAHDHLAQAQRLSRTGSFTSDLALGIHVWSDELYRILEFDPGELVSFKALRALVHPEDRALFSAGFQPTVEDGKDVDVVFRLVTPKGTAKYLRAVAQRVAGSSSTVFMGSIQDITESKLAEEALKASEAGLKRANRFLAGAQRLSKTGSFTWDMGSDEQDWSDENYRIWGFDPTTSPSMAMIIDAVHPEDLAQFAGTVLDARRTGRDFEISHRVVVPGGTVKHLHTVSTRIPDIADRLVYIGSTQDVTASKLAEASLARANAYLTAAQRLARTGSFTWDVAADEHNWSEVIYRFFGFDPGTKVTMARIMAAIHPEDAPQFRTLMGDAARGGNFEMVFRVCNVDGRVRHAHVVGHRIDHISDRAVFIGALQDITARKLAESDLNRARAELARITRVTALGALTASIAHEVNQPLAGIVTNASTCLRLLAMAPPDLIGAQATAQRTIRDCNRASEVIKRLRALFMNKPPSLEQVDVHEAAREVLALSASELQRRRVILQTDFADDAAIVAGDRIQLQQVILNLVLNAAEAMAEIEDRPRELRVSCRNRREGAITLKVCDSGPGIDPRHIDQLFQPFHTTKAEGMGIGLSISRSIVEAHGGRLVAGPNEAGPGATFAFSIPCTPMSCAERRGKRNDEASARIGRR